MSDTESLPNRKWEMIIPNSILLALASSFTIWRLVVRFRVSRLMGISDWLMLLGTILNDAAILCSIVAGHYGRGRLLRDPYWTVERKIRYNHVTYAGQLLNVYGMWIVKLSICAYLIALNFSRNYRWVIWATVVFVTIFNFILPAAQHFGLCRPLAARWDIRIKGDCWSPKVRVGIAYTQAISNIITDLLYATAPIVYLRSVKLSRRTQWSVRAVFLMSLVCTTISALKLWDFQRIEGRKETYYEAISLSVWSSAELSVGIVVANLPCLRKQLDGWFSRIFPGSVSNASFSGNRKLSNSNYRSFNLQSYRSTMSRDHGRNEIRGKGDGLASDDDGESVRAILEETERGENGEELNGILKTTEVHIDSIGKAV